MRDKRLFAMWILTCVLPSLITIPLLLLEYYNLVTLFGGIIYIELGVAFILAMVVTVFWKRTWLSKFLTGLATIIILAMQVIVLGIIALHLDGLAGVQ
jgi:hypothetical protein